MLSVLLVMLPQAQLAIFTTRAHWSLELSSSTLFVLMLPSHLLPNLHRWWSCSCPGRNPEFCICWTSGSSSQPTAAEGPLISGPTLPCVHHLPSSFLLPENQAFAIWKTGCNLFWCLGLKILNSISPNVNPKICLTSCQLRLLTQWPLYPVLLPGHPVFHPLCT